MEISVIKKAKPIVPRERLVNNLKNLLKITSKIDLYDDLINDIPKKWKIFDDLVLLPLNCFSNETWDRIGTFY
jgi:hypothetical protein